MEERDTCRVQNGRHRPLLPLSFFYQDRVCVLRTPPPRRAKKKPVPKKILGSHFFFFFFFFPSSSAGGVSGRCDGGGAVQLTVRAKELVADGEFADKVKAELLAKAYHLKDAPRRLLADADYMAAAAAATDGVALEYAPEELLANDFLRVEKATSNLLDVLKRVVVMKHETSNHLPFYDFEKCRVNKKEGEVVSEDGESDSDEGESEAECNDNEEEEEEGDVSQDNVSKEALVAQLVAITAFSEDRVRAALLATHGNGDLAAEHLMSGDFQHGGAGGLGDDVPLLRTGIITDVELCDIKDYLPNYNTNELDTEDDDFCEVEFSWERKKWTAFSVRFDDGKTESGIITNRITGVHTSEVLLAKVTDYLSEGADVQAVDYLGKTALYWALETKAGPDVVDLLLVNGAVVPQGGIDRATCKAGGAHHHLLAKANATAEIIKLWKPAKGDRVIVSGKAAAVVTYVYDDSCWSRFYHSDDFGEGNQYGDCYCHDYDTTAGSYSKDQVTLIYSEERDQKVIELLAKGADANATTTQVMYENGDDVMYLYDHVEEGSYSATEYEKSALHLAAENQAGVKVISALLSKVEDAHAEDSNGKTALEYAAENGAQPGVLELLSRGADEGILKDAWTTALRVAIDNRQGIELVELLLSKGAIVPAGGIDQTIYRAHHNHHHLAKANATAELLVDLWKKPGRLEQRGDGSEDDISSNITHSRVMDVLSKGADVHAVNSSKKTVLHLAAENQVEVEIVALFLSRGVDAHAADENKKIALHYAAAQQTGLEIVKLLLHKGDHTNSLNAALHIAVTNQSGIEMVEALLSAGADSLNAALHIAVKNQSGIELVKVLLSAGADSLNAALHIAVENRSGIEMVEALLSAGADVQAVDQHKKTALHLAAKADGVGLQMVKLLLKEGAEVHAVDTHGKTALHYVTEDAVSRGRPYLAGRLAWPDELILPVAFLLGAGADPTGTQALQVFTDETVRSMIEKAASAFDPTCLLTLASLSKRGSAVEYARATLEFMELYGNGEALAVQLDKALKVGDVKRIQTILEKSAAAVAYLKPESENEVESESETETEPEFEVDPVEEEAFGDTLEDQKRDWFLSRRAYPRGKVKPDGERRRRQPFPFELLNPSAWDAAPVMMKAWHSIGGLPLSNGDIFGPSGHIELSGKGQAERVVRKASDAAAAVYLDHLLDLGVDITYRQSSNYENHKRAGCGDSWAQESLAHTAAKRNKPACLSVALMAGTSLSLEAGHRYGSDGPGQSDGGYDSVAELARGECAVVANESKEQWQERLDACLTSSVEPMEYPIRTFIGKLVENGADPELLLLAAADTGHLGAARVLVNTYGATGAPFASNDSRTAKQVGVSSHNPPTCRFFKRLGRFCDRYDLGKKQPEHKTATSVVRRATDLEDKNFVLKFMLHSDQFDREVLAREGLDCSFVVGIVATSTDPGFEEFESSATALGYGPYGIVMEAADRNLAVVMLQERLDVRAIAGTMQSLAACLNHLHSKGRIHGDFKPLNAVRTEEGAWKLIDLDASAIIGQEEAGTKYSSAYSPPELAQKLFIERSQQGLVAHPSFDVWGFGVVLFEALTRDVLFRRDASTDNINQPATERELCMWRSIDDERLRSVFGAEPMHDAARHLIAWCLQGSPADRPTMAQVLAHPFLSAAVLQTPPPSPLPPPTKTTTTTTTTPPVPLPQPMVPLRKKHAFVSHFQIEGAGIAHTLYHALQGLGAHAWVDMFEEDLTEQGMKAGVEESDIFLLVLTSKVLMRPFCRKELKWAIDLKKPIFLLREEETRFFPWDYDHWRNNEVWDTAAGNGRGGWVVPADVDELPYDSLGATPEGRAIRDMIDAQATVPGRIMSFRRRDFEQQAMLHELLRRAGDPTCSSSPAIWRCPPPPLALRASTTPSSLVIHAVHLDGLTGSGIRRALQADMSATSSMSHVGWTQDLSRATHAVIILSAGVLSNPSTGAAVEQVVTQRIPFIFVYVPPFDTDGWDFAGAERNAASAEIQSALNGNEAMVYRPPAAFNYEHRAMVGELFRRLARSSMTAGMCP